MMISAHAAMCVSASRFPQPDICLISVSPVSLSPWERRAGLKRASGFQKGRGSSTLAIKQGSSVLSTAGDASDGEVPADDTDRVLDFTGTKTIKLMDPISLPKLTSTVDDQLLPLLSMVIDSLPPLQQSKYVQEAEICLHQYIKRYTNVVSLQSYCRLGLSSTS